MLYNSVIIWNKFHTVLISNLNFILKYCLTEEFEPVHIDSFSNDPVDGGVDGCGDDRVDACGYVLIDGCGVDGCGDNVGFCGCGVDCVDCSDIYILMAVVLVYGVDGSNCGGSDG